MDTHGYIQLELESSARNYHPLPVVLAKGEGVWVEDVDGKRYMDMLSGYSALNHGHRHPRIVKAAIEQLGRMTLTSRAFHNDQMGMFCKELAAFCGMETVLPMNTGAEAVETAIKAARRWAYWKKGVPEDKAEIIVCFNNFHGRTITVISFSTDPSYRAGFGPFTPGFKTIPFGDAGALDEACTPNTAAFLVEPIQGEAGVILPYDGYLREVREICTRKNVLFIADEIQTGLGRTGRRFACDYEDVVPDMYILGKALGGGIVPISAVVSSREIMSVFDPGSHGSTFGGNPFACAVAREALRVIQDEGLAGRAHDMGELFRNGLAELIGNGVVAHVRGRGLLNAVEIASSAGKARGFAEKLADVGILCKETHDTVIRFAPPLVITPDEVNWALGRIRKVLRSPL